MLRHKYNITPAKGYDCPGEERVERSGYRNTLQQVNEFMTAGVALLSSRSKKYGEYFDYPDGNVPENASPDPTRSGNFDLADATQLGRETDARLKNRVKAIKEAQAQHEQELKAEKEKAIPTVGSTGNAPA